MNVREHAHRVVEVGELFRPIASVRMGARVAVVAVDAEKQLFEPAMFTQI
jgi:hypothetical protein